MTTKKKIAVLGGGAASLFAVWDLVHSDPHAYDITVYQMGWRLGGKGASGRNAKMGNRIEEHGLHLMFGFYENVFRVIREAYGEHYSDYPGLWKDFFRTADTEVAMINFLDSAKTKWEPWIVPYPEQGSELPGEPGYDPGNSIGHIIQNLLRWIAGTIHPKVDNITAIVDEAIGAAVGLKGLRSLIDVGHSAVIHAFQSVAHYVEDEIMPWTDVARVFVQHSGGDKDMSDELADDIRRFDFLIENIIEHTRKSLIPDRVKGLVQFATAVARGLFVDLFSRGSTNWFELDEYDFGEWIARHGGDPESPVVMGLYDAVFGTYSRIGAGAILQSSMKAAFLFRGGAIYKMYAGMGDTIFTPLYRALEKRGVKFEFFNRVEQLKLSADKTAVEWIVLERQVQLKNKTYNPLVKVPVEIGALDTLECWPSEPNWDQIADEDRARVEGNFDLENYWIPPAPERQYVLQHGREFDAVILGISVAALPSLCPQLLAEDPAFADHVYRLAPATTATQAFQLWWDKKPKSPRPIVVPFDEPYDTVADMSHLLPAEPGSQKLAGIHYLCSAIQESSPVPPRSQMAYPGALRKAGTRQALAWMNDRAKVLWHNTFDWAHLHDPTNGVGEARFKAQYLNTPINLSDRYVLPVPQSYNYRLQANGTKFTNLYITGDWIKTSLSVGCLEAAAMSGLQAARAVSLELGTQEVPRARGDWIEDVQPRAGSVGARAALASPRFRKRDGEVIAPPPYEATCPNLLMFVLRADKASLQAVCDTHLGASYEPLGDYVVLYATTIATTSTGITCTANEVGVWMPLVTADRSLRTYSPYIWLDSATSTVSARGIFGYAKHTASVEVPPKDQLTRGIKITGDALVSSTGTQLWCTSREVLFTAMPNSLAEGTIHAMHEIGELARTLGSVVREHPTDLISMMRGMRSVFLKQIPAAAGLDASYQKLVEAPIEPYLSTIRGAPLGDWTLKFPAHHEPNVVDTLGLTADEDYDPITMKRISVVKPLAAMWMQFRGRIDPGNEI
jgi:uncharacterized protein with NAD-binding domain and iron-sulfur cluster